MTPVGAPWLRRLLWSAVFAVAMLAHGACSEPLVFPDWTIPVPEGTRIVEYAGVTDEDREGNCVEVLEDLVIAPRGDDDNYAFYRPATVLADSAGRIYVLDGGNARIQIFDANGEYLRTLGQAGSGPREFRAQGTALVTVRTIIAADRLIAYDMTQSRTSIWDADGTHEADHAVTGIRIGPMLAGLADGTFITVTTQRTADVSHRVVVAVSEAGEPQREYVSLPQPGGLRVGNFNFSSPEGAPVFAAGADGTVYASAGDEYQVLAVGPDGEADWALRVAHERKPFTEDDRARMLDVVTRTSPGTDTSDAEWPTHFGAISRLDVDGHGHLFVFGFQPPFAPVPEQVAVDVYAPDGQRLCTGTMPPLRWTAAAGDFIYSVRRDEETGENEPIRYRLVELFGR